MRTTESFALETLETNAMRKELTSNAAAFSVQLTQLAVFIDAEIGQAIRKGVLDVYGNITKRSPVDTGAYRASNSIANHDLSPDEDVVMGTKGTVLPAPNKSGWRWKVGDGDIFLFNNVPYAERLENGWSKQAPQGIYRLALQEFTQFFQQEVAKMKSLLPTGGE